MGVVALEFVSCPSHSIVISENPHSKFSLCLSVYEIKMSAFFNSSQLVSEYMHENNLFVNFRVFTPILTFDTIIMLVS